VKIAGSVNPTTNILKADKFDIKINQVNNVKVNFDNLFNGDPTLSQVGHRFFKENSEFIFQEIRHDLETNLEKYFLKVVNDMISKTTYDELFPDV
jgi:Haemolymph juvenile hormone binding protein (JHBP)